MLKPYSLTIGIPAHNEAKNIQFLLRSILSQIGEHFVLEKIYVLCDGCNDGTAKLAGEIASEDGRVIVIDDHQKKGKTTRLNHLYALNQSELILNLDGDVLLDGNRFIEEMVRIFMHDERACVVAAHMEPICPSGFIGRVAYTNCKLWDKTRMHLNGGDHIANLYGSATMMTQAFSRSFVYPTHITCDEEYLYVLAKKQGGFRYCYTARAFFLPASDLSELRAQATRFRKERFMLESYFGVEVLKLHEVPYESKVQALQKMLKKDPFFTICAVFFNYAIHYLPSIDDLNGAGMWRQATSTKSLVKYAQGIGKRNIL